ncbi:hypothetical membrane protein [Renibacterium salmoninarum ATCC 33209]|uniref:Hypothetical membrane protein n=1 Tax=Renibacterium salmoninarum (strain ATCC 33209 / DSM 20767 / JCM 11484 / NBRC 15589 / NCIMB 2235) TaxID=288705 RepID=A9WKX4_RENSM|nr:ABC transporter permease [Renibacterium salmoninarum]ABY22132.1 hypothetical membrane protein [Renibacterium salmoninarum ATCC 33209]
MSIAPTQDARKVSQISRALSIASAEAKITFRNKTVLSGALFIPLVFGAFYVITGPGPDSPVMQVLLMLTLIGVMGVYLTATTTIATRREELFLKRLRSGEASNGAIYAGMLIPSVVLVLVQLAVILAAFFIRGAELPSQPALLLVAVVLVLAICAACGLFNCGLHPLCGSGPNHGHAVLYYLSGHRHLDPGVPQPGFAYRSAINARWRTINFGQPSLGQCTCLERLATVSCGPSGVDRVICLLRDEKLPLGKAIGNPLADS